MGDRFGNREVVDLRAISNVVEGEPAAPVVDVLGLAKAVDGSTPTGGWRPGAKLYLSQYAPVENSADLQRILELPRRPIPEAGTPRSEQLIELAMQRWGRGDRKCRCGEIDPRIAAGKKKCLKRVNHAQAWALYEIGIVGGLLGALSVGSGKCHDSSTEVYDYRLGRRRSVAEAGALRVASYLEKRLSVHEATAFPSGLKACVRVVLADGSSAVPSADHPYLTHRGWVHASKLHASDFVAVPTVMPEPETTADATDDEVTFVAYMLSDGGCSQNMLGFTNMTPEIIEEWSAVVQRLGYEITEAQSKSKARQFVLRTGNRDLKGRWSIRYSACRQCNQTDRPHSGLGLCRACYQSPRGDYPFEQHENDPVRRRWSLYGLAKEKRGHADLWGLPRRQVALFLNRFWACDGHVAQNCLEITLASEKLIDDLRFLLLRLGVRSVKHFKEASYVKSGTRHIFDAWRLHIMGADAVRFLAEVGDVLGKEPACQTLRAKLSATTRNTNTDVVPVGYREFAEIFDELKLPRVGDPAARGGRSRLRKQYGVTQGQLLSRSRFVEFCRQTGYCGKYAHLATEDVAWVRVSTVAPVGDRVVYDLSVPGPCNFVANGIVVHNSLVDILAPMALEPLGVRLSLCLVPANLIQQLKRDYRLIAEHFKVPTIWIHDGIYNNDVAGAPTLHVLPYSLLSRPKASDWIRNLNPQAIIADEADRLRDPGTATTTRVLRHFMACGDTRLIAMTGSITDGSLTDYGHIAALALREKSPLPLDPRVLEEWGRALDASDSPSDPGELTQLMGEDDEDPSDGYRRRLSETMGVVVYSAPSTTVELVIEEKEAPEIPPIVAGALEKLRSCWVRPDTLAGADYDEELVDAMQVHKVALELASGVFYRWKFPPIHGVPQNAKDIEEWYQARKEWNCELRQRLRNREEHLDSPLLCEHAAQRHWGDRPQVENRPTWDSYTWPRWRDIKTKIVHVTEGIRVSDYLAQDAAQWARENLGVVWYNNVEFGAWVSELSGLPLHGGGPKAGERLAAEVGNRSIIASIKSHGRGRDGLQSLYDTQLITQLPSSATMCEQLLGRIHRQGQEAERVTAYFYAHTAEIKKGLATALRRARYVKGTLGATQKLLSGYRVGE